MEIGKNKKRYEGDYVKLQVETIHKLRKLGVKNGNEIILFSKILSLSNNEKGACTAGNEYFANILGVTERSIQDYIRNLKKVGAIKAYEQKIGCKTTTRFIYPQNISIEDEEGDEESFTQYSTKDSSCDESTTRKIASDHTKDYVEGDEKLRQTTRRGLHPILEEKRIDKKREGGSYEPYGSAGAPPESASVNTSAGYASLLRSADAALAKEREFKFDGAFDNETIKDIILNTFELDFDECSNDLSSWSKRIIKEFTNPNGCYRCSNYDDTEEYIGIMMNTLKSYMQRND